MKDDDATPTTADAVHRRRESDQEADPEEAQDRRNYGGVTGWMIYLPGSYRLPSKYAIQLDDGSWFSTRYLTIASVFDTRRAAVSIQRAYYSEYATSSVSPSIPGAAVTHAGPDARRVGESGDDHAA